MLVLFGCSKSDVGHRPTPGPDGETVAVSFALSGIQTKVLSGNWDGVQSRAEETADPSGPKVVPLDKDKTVRVVVYQRAGSTASLAADQYVTEATYVADEAGELKLCTIAGNTVTVKEDEYLQLKFGTYDFYAITPATETEANHQHVQVTHGMDHAASLTEQIAVVVQPDSEPQKVKLTNLDRKNSKLHFSISRVHNNNVVKAVFNSVQLTKMTKSPATVELNGNIDTSDNSETYTFPAGTFYELNESSQYLSEGSGIVLPKKKDVFEMLLNVTFNAATTANELKATVGTLAFEPGYKYCFNMKVIGDVIELQLTVTEWDKEVLWGTEIGTPGAEFQFVVVGWWTIDAWETEFGGAWVPSIQPDSWHEVEGWQTEFGNLFSLMGSTDDWVDQEWGAESGGGFSPLGSTDQWEDKDWDAGDVGTPRS